MCIERAISKCTHSALQHIPQRNSSEAMRTHWVQHSFVSVSHRTHYSNSHVIMANIKLVSASTQAKSTWFDQRRMCEGTYFGICSRSMAIGKHSIYYTFLQSFSSVSNAQLNKLKYDKACADQLTKLEKLALIFNTIM